MMRLLKQITIPAMFLALTFLIGCRTMGTQTVPVGGAQDSLPEQTEVPRAATSAVLPTAEASKEPEVSLPAEPDPTETPVTDKANADVLFVAARQESADTWQFSVTVEHPDTGWEDYADGWDVVLPDGTVAKPNADSQFTRLLSHPHETEQPFTRSQSGIVLPIQITSVTVRAHDLIDGYGGREVVVDLSLDSGPDFEVKRIDSEE